MNNTIKRTVRHWLIWSIVIVLAGVVLWLYGRVSTLESRLSSIEAGSFNQLSLTISSLEGNQGRPGQYFEFNAVHINVLLGEDGWSGRKFIAVAPDQGVIEPVRLWIKETRGRIGFGRTENDLPNLKWTVGEEIIILY